MNWLYVLFTADILNIAISLPTFGAFVRSLGGTPFSIGLINSSTALVTLLWNPIVGSYSDQVGRKDILIKCLIASAAGTVIMALSSSLILLSLGRFIGAFGSPAGVLLKAIVGDKYKTAEEKKIFFDKCAPFLSVAFLGGSVAGGFLSELKNGFSISYLLMASISGLAAVLVKYNIPSDVKGVGDKKDNNLSLTSKAVQELKRSVDDLKGISWPRYKILFFIKASCDFSLTIITANMGLILLNEYQIQGRYMGLVFLTISLFSILSSILKLKLKAYFDKIPDYELIAKASVLLIVSFIGMGIPNSPILLFFMSLSLMFMLRPVVETILTEMVTSASSEEDRGKVLAAYENLMPVSGFIVPVLSGSLAIVLGQRLVLLLAIIPTAAVVFVANKQNSLDVKSK